MVRINLLRGRRRTGIFYSEKQQKLFFCLAIAFLLVSLSLYTFFYWKLDYTQGELARLSMQIATLDVANKKVLESKEADTKRKIDAFLEQTIAQEAVGAVVTTRKMFLLFPKKEIQVERLSFGPKEIVMAGISSDLGAIMNYMKTLKNNTVSSRNWKLVSAKQREVKGRKVHEFLIRCERGEKTL